MKVIELLDLLTDVAKEYAPDAPVSVLRNKHMHAYRGPLPSHALTDAVVVDFINTLGRYQGVDLALYTTDLRP